MGEEPEEILEPDGLSRSLKSGLYDTNYTVLNRNYYMYIVHVVSRVHIDSTPYILFLDT